MENCLLVYESHSSSIYKNIDERTNENMVQAIQTGQPVITKNCFYAYKNPYLHSKMAYIKVSVNASMD